MLRDANLSERAWDTVETWTKSSYDLVEIATALRRLERPTPGKGTSQVSGMTGLELGSPAETHGMRHSPMEPAIMPPPTPISQCLFLSLEQFQDEVLFEALDYASDPNTFFIAGDIPQDVVLGEEETVAVMANYNQVRKYLHTQKLGRGFFKGKGKGRDGKTKGLGQNAGQKKSLFLAPSVHGADR